MGVESLQDSAPGGPSTLSSCWDPMLRRVPEILGAYFTGLKIPCGAGAEDEFATLRNFGSGLLDLARSPTYMEHIPGCSYAISPYFGKVEVTPHWPLRRTLEIDDSVQSLTSGQMG